MKIANRAKTKKKYKKDLKASERELQETKFLVDSKI
jgi:hypothetical protein